MTRAPSWSVVSVSGALWPSALAVVALAQAAAGCRREPPPGDGVAATETWRGDGAPPDLGPAQAIAPAGDAIIGAVAPPSAGTAGQSVAMAGSDAAAVSALSRGAASAVPAAGTRAASDEAAASDVRAARDVAVHDPENRLRPEADSADLQERASHLLDAIVSGDPAKGDDFFFPRAPFLPLKDVADPGRYFDYLLSTYHADVREIRARHNDWTDARFVRFVLGTTPGWVAPGREYNKIGYFRSYNGKLSYEIGGRRENADIKVVISWGGRWFITHLGAIRH